MATFATRMRDPHGDPQTSPQHADPHKCFVRLSFRHSEKGAFAKGALRKSVANCAPNLRKIASSSFHTSEKGCAKLTVATLSCKFESQFRTILCKYPFSNAPFSTLRAKGTLISEPRFSTPREMRFFPREKGKTVFSKKNPRQRPFSLSRVGKIASRAG